MNIKWFKGLDEQQKKEMKVQILESRLVLDRLAKLLREELEESVTDMAKKEHFYMPSWSEYQASRLGEQRALRKAIELIEG